MYNWSWFIRAKWHAKRIGSEYCLCELLRRQWATASLPNRPCVTTVYLGRDSRWLPGTRFIGADDVIQVLLPEERGKLISLGMLFMCSCLGTKGSLWLIWESNSPGRLLETFDCLFAGNAAIEFYLMRLGRAARFSCGKKIQTPDLTFLCRTGSETSTRVQLWIEGFDYTTVCI